MVLGRKETSYIILFNIKYVNIISQRNYVKSFDEIKFIKHFPVATYKFPPAYAKTEGLCFSINLVFSIAELASLGKFCV